MGSVTEEFNSLRVVGSVASTESVALKQGSETSQGNLDGCVKIGRACCGKFQGLSAYSGKAEVSKDQGVPQGCLEGERQTVRIRECAQP